MTFEEFNKLVENTVLDYFEGDTENKAAEVLYVYKNKEKFAGLIVRDKDDDSEVYPTFYLNDYFQDVVLGEKPEYIISCIAKEYEKEFGEALTTKEDIPL
jgi:hypothetical protein